jgi:enoyl-[acyl-carrier protein] reductase I
MGNSRQFDQSKKQITTLAPSCPGLARRSGDQTSRFELLDKAKAKAPSRSLVRIDDVGIATAFLAHDAERLVTGETLYIDGGYHIIN